jgi:hypothetical protein
MMIFFGTPHSELQESMVLAQHENYERRADFRFRLRTEFSR